MNLVRLYKTLLPLALLASFSLHAQEPKPVYTPLGDTLTKALEISSLTTPGSAPFHVKLHIHNPDDATQQADIEESGPRPPSGSAPSPPPASIRSSLSTTPAPTTKTPATTSSLAPRLRHRLSSIPFPTPNSGTSPAPGSVRKSRPWASPTRPVSEQQLRWARFAARELQALLHRRHPPRLFRRRSDRKHYNPRLLHAVL